MSTPMTSKPAATYPADAPPWQQNRSSNSGLTAHAPRRTPSDPDATPAPDSPAPHSRTPDSGTRSLRPGRAPSASPPPTSHRTVRPRVSPGVIDVTRSQAPAVLDQALVNGHTIITVMV